MFYIKLWTEILLTKFCNNIYIKIGSLMNFHETGKKLQKGSHDLCVQNQNIVYLKIWNPRACLHTASGLSGI